MASCRSTKLTRLKTAYLVRFAYRTIYNNWGISTVAYALLSANSPNRSSRHCLSFSPLACMHINQTNPAESSNPNPSNSIQPIPKTKLFRRNSRLYHPHRNPMDSLMVSIKILFEPQLEYTIKIGENKEWMISKRGSVVGGCLQEW